MCGIFALLNYTNATKTYGVNVINNDIIKNEFNKGQGRGPEFSKLEYFINDVCFGFHRLAINGLNSESNQPIFVNDVVLICNGEIYNYKKLYEHMRVSASCDSDCEVIIHLYIKYGIEQTLTMLDGVFSFILLDKKQNSIYVARDPYGVRPLYFLGPKNLNLIGSSYFGFASELKCLEYFYNLNSNLYSINQFEPGTYSKINYLTDINVADDIRATPFWKIDNFAHFKPYFIPSFSYGYYENYNLNEESDDFYNKVLKSILYTCSEFLVSAVNKRCITTERPIACLLSGGLDSSLITALVNNYYRKNNQNALLQTYSIGLEGSEDLKYARIVANYLETNHTEIIVTEDEMFNAIPEVIYAIESYDTTTVRASIGNYLLGKYISKNSNAKVIFNGDGSDELLGGYLYMNKCPDDIEFDRETRRLLKYIHTFDVLRSDKSISSHGLEPRTPFLDKSFVNYILSLSPYIRNHRNFGKCEKYLIREAFSINNFKDASGKQILPNEILWRKKEAFSDGVSSHGRSLYQILQEKIAEQMGNEFEANVETEKKYYKHIFLNHYGNCDSILPHYWMPKYTDATDPSARTLNFYK